MNKSQLFKILAMGVIFTAITIIMQKLVGGPILVALGLMQPEKGPPETFFLVTISIVSFICGCFFSLAYVLNGNKLPIQNPILRAIVFGMLIFVGNYFAQSFGLIGANGENVIMTFRYKDFLFDFLSYLISFTIMGLLFKDKKEIIMPKLNKSSAITAICSGAVIFPLLMILFTQIIALIIPSENLALALKVDKAYELAFYIGFYCCFIISGTMISLQYILTEFGESSKNRVIKFSLIYAVLIWLPIVAAMIAFGMNILSVIIFMIESIVVVFLTIFILDKIIFLLNKKQINVKQC